MISSRNGFAVGDTEVATALALAQGIWVGRGHHPGAVNPSAPAWDLRARCARAKRNEPVRNLPGSKSIRLKMAVTVGFELTSVY
jgi:hypothetical protein